MRNEVNSRTSNVRYYYRNTILWNIKYVPGVLTDIVQDFVDDCIPGKLSGSVLGLTKLQQTVSLYSALKEITRNLK